MEQLDSWQERLARGVVSRHESDDTKLSFGAVPVGRHVTHRVTLENVSVEPESGAPRALTLLVFPDSPHIRVALADPNQGPAPAPPPGSPTFYLEDRPQSAPARMPTAPACLRNDMVLLEEEDADAEEGTGSEVDVAGGAAEGKGVLAGWQVTRPRTEGVVLAAGEVMSREELARVAGQGGGVEEDTVKVREWLQSSGGGRGEGGEEGGSRPVSGGRGSASERSRPGSSRSSLRSGGRSAASRRPASGECGWGGTVCAQ